MTALSNLLMWLEWDSELNNKLHGISHNINILNLFREKISTKQSDTQCYTKWKKLKPQIRPFVQIQAPLLMGCVLAQFPASSLFLPLSLV